jgi:ComF family protein
MIIADFFDFIYPRSCCGCGKALGRNEDSVCVDCFLQLPLTFFEKEHLNPVSNELFARVPIKEACAAFHFVKDGTLQKMLHLLKYCGNKNTGIFLGKQLGKILAASGNYNDIDCIIPVPINIKKQKLRGYNQATVIAEGVREYLPRPLVCDILIKPITGESQTRKNRYERYENLLDGFTLCESENTRKALENKHILLIDDVITTGATIERCAKELLKIHNVTISATAVASPM